MCCKQKSAQRNIAVKWFWFEIANALKYVIDWIIRVYGIAYTQFIFLHSLCFCIVFMCLYLMRTLSLDRKVFFFSLRLLLTGLSSFLISQRKSMHENERFNRTRFGSVPFKWKNLHIYITFARLSTTEKKKRRLDVLNSENTINMKYHVVSSRFFSSYLPSKIVILSRRKNQFIFILTMIVAIHWHDFKPINFGANKCIFRCNFKFVAYLQLVALVLCRKKRKKSLLEMW